MYIDMILEKAIFIKINQLHFSDQQLFDAATSGFIPSKCSCSKCNTIGRLTEIHSYKRDMISVENGKRIDTTLIIPRYRCDSCGRTHALLPDVLIPYGSYSLRFILFILQAYLHRSCTVAELCEAAGFQRWMSLPSTLWKNSTGCFRTISVSIIPRFIPAQVKPLLTALCAPKTMSAPLSPRNGWTSALPTVPHAITLILPSATL